MRLFKKAAALFFCLALALSVMAVTALADDVNPNFVVSLTTSDSNTDVNGNSTGPEYTSGSTVTYNVQLAADSQQVVDAFDITVTDSAATLGAITLSAESAFATVEKNGNGVYTIATAGGTGVTVQSATTVATLTFTLTGNPGDTKTFSVGSVLVKGHALGDGYAATPATVSKTVEVDPQYSVTINNPSLDNNGVIETSPTYTEVTGSANNYKILAGLGTDNNITEPTLAHYKFAGYVVDTASSAGSWAALTGDAVNIATTEALKGLLNDHAHWGDVVLNAQYTPEKFNLVVKKATPQTNGTIDTSSTESYGYVTTDVTQYQYDITGAVFDSTGENTATLAATTVDVPYYDFKEFVPVASTSGNGNWEAADVQNPTAQGYSFPVGKWGNAELDATYTPIVYTITLQEPDVDDNGVIDNTKTAIDADTASVTYTVEGYVNVTDKATEAAAIPATTKTAYTFQNYTVVSADDATAWSGTIGDTSGFSIPAGKNGAVTLKAVFSATPYTVTYSLGDNAGFTGTGAVVPTSVSQTTTYTSGTFAYNIEDTDDSESFTFGTPVRPGFAFTGWTAAGTNGATISASFPTTVGENSITPIPAGVWGDVTLTANWKIVGKFAQAAYWYTTTDKNLILFAVESVPKNGHYVYRTGGENSVDLPMYTTDKASYKTLFSDANALTEGTNYTIFATIATATGANIDKVVFVAGDANGSIDYQGDVTGNSQKNAGDYGNVVAMLGARTYTNSVLDAADNSGIKARLEADITIGNDETSDSLFGTIDDVKAIMNIVLNPGA